MMTPEQALKSILDKIGQNRTGGSRTSPLEKACGQILASDVFAPMNLPAFDNSSMDGYALDAGETNEASPQNIIDLDIQGEQPAGKSLGLKLRPGHCIRIFTGAPLPSGANAVVMQEDVKVMANCIFLETPVVPGEFIRRAGQDVCEGQKVIHAGTLLDERHLGLLAALGVSEVSVGKAPRVAILVTGSELRGTGETLEPGEIYESNRMMLSILVQKAGGIAVCLPVCRDDLTQIATAIDAALHCDAVIICGGMSVGAHDYIQRALKKCQVPIEFWRVALKPGKPFLFSIKDKVPVFGLPGNPVSAYVTFLLFVRPALRLMAGSKEAREINIRLPLGEKIVNDEKRFHFMRGRIKNGRAFSSGRQASHLFSSLIEANCLLKIPPESVLEEGTPVDCLLLENPDRSKLLLDS